MRSNLVLKTAVALVCGLFVCGPALAVDSSTPSYKLGGMTVYPGLGVSVKNDNNIFRSSDTSASKTSSAVTVVSPSVLFQAEKSANTFSLMYGLDIGRFSNSTADNYVDQNLAANADLEFSSRASMKIMPGYRVGHDDRGATFGAETAEPSKWNDGGILGSFTYGAEEARAKTMVEFDYADRQYQNNRTVTVAYDRKTTGVGGTVYFRVQPKTSLLAHVKHTGIDYSQASSTLNGKEQRVMVGLQWEATAQSTGEFKIGQVQKKFDTTYATFTGTTWEGMLRWSPVTYVNADIFSSKKPNESTLSTASTIVISMTGANVAYDLNDRITVSVNGYQMTEDFINATRSDDTSSFGLKAEYKFRSWLVGGAEFSSTKKTSPVAGADYKRDVFMLSIKSVL